MNPRFIRPSTADSEIYEDEKVGRMRGVLFFVVLEIFLQEFFDFYTTL